MKSFDRRWQLVLVGRAVCGILLSLEVSCANATGAPPATSLVPQSAAVSLSNGPTETTVASIAESTSPDSLVPPAGSIYFGALVNPADTAPPYEDETERLERQLGRTLALHAHYYTWTHPFPNAEETEDYAHGRVPVISWDCGAKAINVINGKQDSVIKAHALSMKAYGHRIFLRYFWEMNLPFAVEQRPTCVDVNRDVNGYIAPADYINAWNHIRSIFISEGATNVAFLWCPSGFLKDDPMPYYPGSAQTEWIGFDHYDVTGTVGLLDTLAAPYALLSPLKKPMMLAETGTISASQPSYLSTAPAIMEADFPKIRGLIYFDEPSTRADWNLTPNGVSAAKEAAETPYFSAVPDLR